MTGMRNTWRVIRRFSGTTRTMLAGVLVLLGCQADLATPPLVGEDDLAWRIHANHRAITLALTAPHNTVQLDASVVNADGTIIADASAPAYRSTDTTKVRVSATGLVTAVAAGSGINIIARAQHNQVTVVDTIPVVITATGPVSPLIALDIAWFSGDTIVMQRSGALLGAFPPFVSVSTTSAGGPLFGLAVKFWIANPAVVGIPFSAGTFASLGLGTTTGVTMLYAEATAYGVTKRDSIPCKVTPDVVKFSHATVLYENNASTPKASFNPASFRLARGGIVIWSSAIPNVPVDIVFDDPTAATVPPPLSFAYFSSFPYPTTSNQTGNIAAFTYAPDSGSAVRRARQFNRTGSFRYHSVSSGVSGTIVVE